MVKLPKISLRKFSPLTILFVIGELLLIVGSVAFLQSDKIVYTIGAFSMAIGGAIVAIIIVNKEKLELFLAKFKKTNNNGIYETDQFRV